MAVWGMGPTATTVTYIKEARVDIFKERKHYGSLKSSGDTGV